MRFIFILLLALLALLQYPLWIGKGGWLRVWEVSRQLQAQKKENLILKARNAGLDAEVRDLKQGFSAIEERARHDLGMLRQDEIFVQIPDQNKERQGEGEGHETSLQVKAPQEATP